MRLLLNISVIFKLHADAEISSPLPQFLEQTVLLLWSFLVKETPFFYLDNKSAESARSADTRTPEPKWMFELFLIQK